MLCFADCVFAIADLYSASKKRVSLPSHPANLFACCFILASRPSYCPCSSSVVHVVTQIAIDFKVLCLQHIVFGIMPSKIATYMCLICGPWASRDLRANRAAEVPSGLSRKLFAFGSACRLVRSLQKNRADFTFGDFISNPP